MKLEGGVLRICRLSIAKNSHECLIPIQRNYLWSWRGLFRPCRLSKAKNPHEGLIREGET